MSDDLHLRGALPVEFRYLETDYPRADWQTLALDPSARRWLEVHAWFRGMLGDLTALGGALREGQLEPASYRVGALPRLRQWLGNLHGHHGVESQHYFPALTAAEPDMARGFARLDRDHEAIEHLMSTMATAAMGLQRAAAEARDLAAPADALAGEVERGGGLIGRHLWDEEEIVIPVLTLRGDPFQH